MEWASAPDAEAAPRRSPARPAQPLPRALHALNALHVKKNAVRDCELWPPRSFPSVSDVYALKLEYDCRNRAIAHQRYDLASQEARQSTALAEKQDRPGIEEKNRWAEREQGALESRQRELDAWRDEVIKKLQAVEPEVAPSPAQT